MDTTQWSQGITVVKRPMEEGLISSTTNNINTKRPTPQQSQQLVERRTRPLKEQALNCPRCNSTNTKFCYYNNYSLTQPRYFCKACRRYWTEGGSLRNVPVGGGSRKNKKHSSSSSSSNKIINNLPNSHDPKPYQGQDLNLGFPINNSLPQLIGGSFPNIESITTMNNNNNNNNNGGVGLSALELLRSTTSAMYHDFSSSSSIIGDGMQLFPFGDLKQVFVKSSANENEQNKWQGGDQAIFWNGGANLGGGSW